MRWKRACEIFRSRRERRRLVPMFKRTCLGSRLETASKDAEALFCGSWSGFVHRRPHWLLPLRRLAVSSRVGAQICNVKIPPLLGGGAPTPASSVCSSGHKTNNCAHGLARRSALLGPGGRSGRREPGAPWAQMGRPEARGRFPSRATCGRAPEKKRLRSKVRTASSGAEWLRC